MSFILDALKKSETDRQQKGTAEFAGVPTSTRRESTPRWLWVMGPLLAVNLLFLMGLLLRPNPASVEMAARPDVSPPPQPETQSTSNFAERVAAARENAPLPQDPGAAPEPGPNSTTSSGMVTTEPVAASSSTQTDSLALPTFYELVANGTFDLPELHVDIHVYSEIAEDRFVFINMSKYKEESQLAEGPTVREITPQGVVLDQNGTSFLLPRD